MFDAALESAFHRDVVAGLSARHKALPSKYFYDAAGDRLFQAIMACPEYYLTRAEASILAHQAGDIVRAAAARHARFDVVELGAGDASKSVHLLREAERLGCSRHYFPIDISANVIGDLQRRLPGELKGVAVSGMVGEYLPALARVQALSAGPKLVMFMGSTIGNWLPGDALAFGRALHAQLKPGDLLLVGFDLKKDPATILAAYNDAGGLTREFNLNLLRRINAELGADFDEAGFQHYPVYDPGTGACKSYLISRRAQQVRLGDGTVFGFAADEPLHLEVSQKYDLDEIDALGRNAGFQAVATFLDDRRYFADVLWQKT